jgi:hypothetical protein
VRCLTQDERETTREDPAQCGQEKRAAQAQEERAAQAQRSAVARNPRGGGFGPESVAPLLGLNATRSAHGLEALHSVRRHYCPVEVRDERGPTKGTSQPAATRIETLPRMIHIALPRPNEKEGESAPLNWVLNENAVSFLRKAADLDFNVKQAEILRDTLRTLEGDAGSPEASGVAVAAGASK